MAERAGCEHYIPVRKSELVDLLCRQPELSEEERTHFRQFCKLLDATIHFGYHACLEELKDAYAHFNPDADTRAIGAHSAAEREAQVARLFAQFVELLERANFVRLSQSAVTDALDAASEWGLNLAVDFDVFDRLEIFARGDMMGERTRRNWRTRFRSEVVPVPVYQRLVLILRLRDWKQVGKVVDTQSVYIKVFKEIPKVDLEMLLPGTRVQLSLLDRGPSLLPTLSGIVVTLSKVVQGAVMAIGGLASKAAFLGLLGGTFGYGLRSFYGYLQTKQKYQLNLTQSLYYQNLDNNAGAIFLLLNEAEEQEFREAVLAYYVLLLCATPEGRSRAQLDDDIEAFLEQVVGMKVDFEIGDAVEKLIRFRLVEERPGDRLRAVSLSAALEALDKAWDDAFKYHSPAKSQPTLNARAA